MIGPRQLMALGAIGCVVEPVDNAVPAPPQVTVSSLWAEQPAIGDAVVLSEVQVTSPRTADGVHFFIQDLTGGPGLAVHLGGALVEWPPLMGTPVSIAGTWISDESGPELLLDAQGDAEVLGGPIELVAQEWSPTTAVGSLVEVRGVTVMSDVDPAGLADIDSDVGLDDAFGVDPPGWGAHGDLIGINVTVDRVSPRRPQDWYENTPAMEPSVTTIAEIRAGEITEGTPVRLEGVVQATPWSTDGRYVVVQDASAGLWVDAEAWGAVAGTPGDVVDWEGEVRSGGEGLRLRSWTDAVVVTQALVQTSDQLEDGAVVEQQYTEVSGPDVYGDWSTAEGVILDDRFGALEGLPSVVVVTGAVRIDPEGWRIAVLTWSSVESL